MTTVIAVIIICAVLIIIDIVPLYQGQQWLSFLVYACLLLVALVLSVLMGLNIDIPSPADPLKKIISLIWGLE